MGLNPLTDRHQPISPRAFNRRDGTISAQRAIRAEHEPSPAKAFNSLAEARDRAWTKDDFLSVASIVKLVHQRISLSSGLNYFSFVVYHLYVRIDRLNYLWLTILPGASRVA